MNSELSAAEARVLGVLIEKHLSTPDHYPLSINAATNACNQKSNRNPVVQYNETEVQGAVDLLHRKQLAGRSISRGSRTTKYRHSLGETWKLQRPELAVLASLLLRGAQTIGELRTRTSRMNQFDSIDEVADVVDRLANRDEPLVTHLPRRPGQKEARCAHLLCGEVVDADVEGRFAEERLAKDPIVATAPDATRPNALDELRNRVDALEKAFAEFRKQFE